MKDRLHHLRDPLYGFVGLTARERAVVDSEPFQRLRGIRQLGLASHVYPGAEHSRFGHAIGVMETATRLFDAIATKHGRDLHATLGWNDDDIARRRQILRLAALLHDVGHSPFSHAAEMLLPDGISHERFTVRILLAEPLAPLVNAVGAPHGFTAADVAALIEGHPSEPFLHQFLSGDLDADRMDYLLRDSYLTGVPNGRFDHERLIHTLTLRIDEAGAPHLAIEEGGLHVAEALLLARTFMFLQVYFHPVCRAFGYHLVELMRSVLPGGRYPSDVAGFLGWTDARVEVLLREAAATGNDHARRIVRRDPLRLVSRTSEHAEAEELAIFGGLVSRVREGFPGVSMFVDSVSMDLVGDPQAELTMRRKADGSFVRLRDASSLIASLQPISARRLYVPLAHRDTVAAFCAR